MYIIAQVFKNNKSVKYVVGLYEEARRQGFNPTLTQAGIPCDYHMIASKGETPVEISNFCKAALSNNET